MVDCNRLTEPAVRAIALNPCKRVVLRRSNLVEGKPADSFKSWLGAKIRGKGVRAVSPTSGFSGRLAMSTGWKFRRISGVLVLCAALCLGMASFASEATSQTHRKAKKAVPLPPLPSGPTGPVQQIPLDSIAPVPPQVSYQNSQLTIIAPNSTLGDILRAVRKQTGAEIEIPTAPERVVTHLGPGPAREVVAELLNGSRFNYVLMGSSTNDATLSKVVLVAKTGPDTASGPNGPTLAEQQQLGIVPGNPVSSQQDPGPDANEAEAQEENTDEAADQAAAEAEQPAPDQPAAKTPQEMLQEMQQRQLMLQQQQPPGQPPVPGT